LTHARCKHDSVLMQPLPEAKGYQDTDCPLPHGLMAIVMPDVELSLVMSASGQASELQFTEGRTRENPR
jgi:hypothetical protein